MHGILGKITDRRADNSGAHTEPESHRLLGDDGLQPLAPAPNRDLSHMATLSTKFPKALDSVMAREKNASNPSPTP